MKNFVLIGYSGHSYMAIEIAFYQGYKNLGYCDLEEKSNNPYKLNYLGKELDRKNLDLILVNDYFIAIGQNQARCKIEDDLLRKIAKAPISLIHPKAVISKSVLLSESGILVMPNTNINALSTIGKGTIINTGAIIEHECIIGAFAHIAPGAVLAGNVSIGECTFIGANSVVKQGINIGSNVIVGAGSVVLKDIPDNSVVFGNPAKIIKRTI